MDRTTTGVIDACTASSDAEQATFPQIIGRLLGVGVERYHADLCRFEKTYFLPSGESHVTPCERLAGAAAPTFVAAQVEAAIRASQAQRIGYREFCRLVLAAGCVGYHVSLVGRRAVYYGRTGDLHVEHFPTAQPQGQSGSGSHSPAAGGPP